MLIEAIKNLAKAIERGIITVAYLAVVFGAVGLAWCMSKSIPSTIWAG